MAKGMVRMAPEITPSDSMTQESETTPTPTARITGKKFFFGPNGIRAGWRMLIAIALFVLFVFLMQAGVKRVPAFEAWRHSVPKGVFTPGIMLIAEGVQTLSLVLAVLVMTFIEGRSFADYGLPGKEAFGKRFWQGMPYGFAMITLMLALVALRYGFLYLIAFILTGIFEELSFRGYLQATLASATGFWPAAVVLAVGFGALHLRNLGEAPVGALSAGSFGLLCAFTLRRTGNIWFAIGMHTAWDWGETYFYGVADSGQLARGHLLNSSFLGPVWLTGGSVGPEGSVFVFVVLILSAAIIHFMFPARRIAS
jgi:membrane protease YdiL (CAAX protease family)